MEPRGALWEREGSFQFRACGRPLLGDMASRASAALLALWAATTCALSVPPSYVTPIGPFCPFRSAACADGSPLAAAFGELSMEQMPKFATEMARLQLTMSTGGEPDVKRVRELADQLSTAEESWRAVLTRMRLSTDFQSRE